MFDSCSEAATCPHCPTGPCVASIERFRLRAVRRAIEYMNANLSHSVRLEDIAGAVGLRVFRFSRTFRHTTGLAPHRYLTHARIERVKVLLLGSEQSLASIADETGFSDQSHPRLSGHVLGLPLHCPVPATRARPVADDGRAVVAALGIRVHRRLHAYVGDRAPDTTGIRHGLRPGRQRSSLAVLVIGSLVFSLGLTPVVSLTTDMVVGAAPPERAGAAASLSETATEFGGALGIAVFGSIGTAVYRSKVSNAIPPDVALR